MIISTHLQMFQRTPQRDGTERLFILVVDGRPTQNEFTIIQRANELKQLGVRIVPVVFEQQGFADANLWNQVSSLNSYISIDPSRYNELERVYLERIHNFACGKNKCIFINFIQARLNYKDFVPVKS